MYPSHLLSSDYFFPNDSATSENYTLSLHDALPILPIIRTSRDTLLFWTSAVVPSADSQTGPRASCRPLIRAPFSADGTDRKSTRLNSSHANISYAVFCLKKKTSADPRVRLRGVS